MQEQIPLTGQEALSGIFGSISLVIWIVVLVPQLAQNYLNSSASSISLAFLLIWLIGDIANLIGAAWARLVPTVVALAIYFCFADAVLLSQVIYYNTVNARRERREEEEGRGKGRRGSNGVLEHGGSGYGTLDSAAEVASHSNDADRARRDTASTASDDHSTEPLLSRRTSAASASLGHPLSLHQSNVGLPGSHRRKSTNSSQRHSKAGSQPDNILTRVVEEQDAAVVGRRRAAVRRAWVKNILSILVIAIIGTAGWAVAYKTGAWTPAPTPGQERDGPRGGGNGGNGAKSQDTPVGAEILGYLSAVAYLGARIPQIMKNWREKSCEGLSLLFFLLSLLGNLSYGAGILAHSLDREYVMTNLPWLIGSLGTMVEDVMIFVQFHMYGGEDEAEEWDDDEEAVE